MKLLKITKVVILNFYLLNSECDASIKKMESFPFIFDEYLVPHAEFSINGFKINAMIDTGTSFGFHIPEDKLDIFDDLVKIREYQSTDASGKVNKKIEFLSDKVLLNNLVLRDVRISPFKKWGILLSGKGKLPEGPVIGLGAFKDKTVYLNYITKKISILDGPDNKKNIKHAFEELDFNLSSNGLIISVQHGTKTYNLVLDTGATVSMIWSERVKNPDLVSCLNVNPEMDNYKCESILISINTKSKNVINSAAVLVRGDFTHMEDVDGLLGNNFFHNKEVVIDFVKKKIFIYEEHKIKK